MAKKQCEIASSDTAHDDQITFTIDAATSQFERDTDLCLLTQTQRVYLEQWPCEGIQLPKRPIQSITSVLYYDDSDTQQTLSTSVYSLAAPMREVRLKYNQIWPSVNSERWDAIQINYVCGFTSASDVPATMRQALLLLIGYYFGQNRGDNDRPNDMAAYENLVKKCLRSSYP